MSKKIKFKTLLLLIFTYLLVVPINANAKDYITEFNNLFSSGSISINTDYEITDTSGLSQAASNYAYSYNTLEYFNSPTDNSNINLILTSCNYETSKCSFALYRYKNSNGTYTNEKLAEYNDITININRDVNSYFTFVDADNNIKINYAEDMFENEAEKNNYIAGYISNLSVYDSDSSISYKYDSYSKVLTRVDKTNSSITLIASKKINDFIFEYIETPYSEEFKKLTSGTLTIKSDTDITSSILSSYLTNYAGTIYFSIDGEVKNNKVYIKLCEYKNGSTTIKEKHLVTIVRDSSIDKDIFAKVNYDSDFIDIKAETPSNKTYFYQSYFNRISYTKSESDYTYYFGENQLYGTDDVILSFIKRKTDNYDEILDIQFHKASMRFIGYSTTYSEEFKKVGSTITVNADELNDNTINEAIHGKLGYKYSNLGCNQDYSICDIGLFDDELNTVEIHKINVKLDNNITDEFKKEFNINADNTIDIIMEDDNGLNYLTYSYYNENTENSLMYYCNQIKCTLTLNNYNNNKYESHDFNYNVVVKKQPTSYYSSKIKDSIDIYAGETTDIWNRMWVDKFNKTNKILGTINNCNKSTQTCTIALLNDSNNIEVHTSKVNLKDGKSPEFNKLFSNDKIQFNAVYKNDQDYITRLSMAYLMGKTQSWSYLTNYNNGKAQLFLNDLESHTMNVEFVNGNQEHQNIIDKAIQTIDSANLKVNLVDLEFINDFYYNDETEFFSKNYNSKQLYDSFYNVINDKHISYFYVPEGGGGDYFAGGMSGKLVLFYDGIAYGSTNNYIETNMYHVIYIPNDTPDTIDDYIKAAQKRIDDYLGKDSGVTVNYSRTVNPDELDYVDLNLEGHDGNSYHINFKDKQAEFLIIKDSSKMQKSTFTAVDVNNNVTVSSNNATYPTNTIVSSEKMDKNEKEYKQILEKLGITDAEVFDINLYSTLLGNIKDFKGINFNVNVPLTNSDLNSGDLYAYYIDDNGKIEEHPITINDFMASFDTTHFSTYIISKKISDDKLQGITNGNEENPGTYDDITLWITLGVISLGGIVITAFYKKKEIFNSKKKSI